MDRQLNTVREIAREKGISGQIDISNRKNKRFVITKKLRDGTTRQIHFGLWPYKKHGTFIDHRNEAIRYAWKSRHQKIMKDGNYAYLDVSSPEYYSWNLLW